MANRKKTKGKTTIYKKFHRKQERATRTSFKTWVKLMRSERVGRSCSSSYTDYVAPVA